MNKLSTKDIQLARKYLNILIQNAPEQILPGKSFSFESKINPKDLAEIENFLRTNQIYLDAHLKQVSASRHTNRYLSIEFILSVISTKLSLPSGRVRRPFLLKEYISATLTLL